MLEGLPVLNAGLQLHRLAMTKREIVFFEEMEVDPADAEENSRYFGSLDVTPEEHLNFTFSGRQSPSRFTDGSLPVLYTAIEVETALAERAHWLSVVPGHPMFFQFLHIDFQGTYKDLCVLTPPPSYLTGNIDSGAYELCVRVTKEAAASGLDAFQTPSARNPGGVCCPVISRHAVRRMDLRGYVRFDYDENTSSWRSRII